jgi:flagellar M-ring protein FliF
VEAAGRVRRLTAAVLINYRRTGRGKQASRQARTPEEMKRLTDLAQSAIGFDPARGDQVSVEELEFDDDAGAPEPGMGERVLTMADQSQSLLRYGTILAAILAFFLFVARPGLRWLATDPARQQAHAAPGVHSQILSEPEPEELSLAEQEAELRKTKAQSIFEQVSEVVRRDPAQSTRLLESWIRSD